MAKTHWKPEGLHDVTTEMAIDGCAEAEDADQVFKKATDAGFKTLMPMADMFWGDRMGKVADRWGNEWTIAIHVKDMTPAEMKAAQDAFVASQK